jgi:hypothetical protein
LPERRRCRLKRKLPLLPSRLRPRALIPTGMLTPTITLIMAPIGPMATHGAGFIPGAGVGRLGFLSHLEDASTWIPRRVFAPRFRALRFSSLRFFPPRVSDVSGLLILGSDISAFVHGAGRRRLSRWWTQIAPLTCRNR